MVNIVKPITEEYLLELESKGQRYEVVNGELREVEVTGENHGRIEGKFIIFLGSHVLAKNLGQIYPGDVDFVLDGKPGGPINLKYQPDVAFVKAENVVSTPGLIYRAPDLAVEIISPSQSYDEIRTKCNDYLTHGTSQVWMVIPKTKEIEVRFPDGTSKTYKIGDLLPGGDLLPEFSLDVASIFA